MRLALPKDGSPIDWEIESVACSDTKYIIKTEQDEAPILEHNEQLRNSGNKGEFTFGRQVASIPIILWERWVKQYPILNNINHDKEASKILFRLINEHPKVKTNNDRLGTPLTR